MKTWSANQESSGFIHGECQILLAWADTSGYDLHNVNWLRLLDGGFELTFPKDAVPNQQGELVRSGSYRMALPPPDTLGYVTIGHTRFPFQVALDLARQVLERDYANKKVLWDRVEINKKWGQQPPSERQKWFIKSVMPEADVDSLTKQQASEMISKMKRDKEDSSEANITYIYPIDPDSPPPHWTRVEVTSVNKEPFEVYDYDPGPGFLMDEKKETVARDFTQWLRVVIRVGYKQCNNDVTQLIARINKSKREGYGLAFMRNAPQYSYLCKLSGMPISRRDLMAWLAQVADQLIPCIIEADILRVDENVSVEKAKPDLTAEPLNSLMCQFPDTEFMLKKSKRRKLPKFAEEIANEDKEKYIAKAREREKKKAAAEKAKSKGKSSASRRKR